MIWGAGGIGGLTGWRLLQRTANTQIARLADDPGVLRERTAFAHRMAGKNDVNALVGDYRSLKVALTAFGLEGDLANKAFVKTVLSSDLSDEGSLANRLADKRYRSMAALFGYGDNLTPKSDAAEIVDQRFVLREFERRVGENDETMRLALYARRELQGIATSDSSDQTKWYAILGSAPVAKVVREGLGLPSSLIRAPVDQQIETMRNAASRRLGIDGPGGLTDPAKLDRLLDNFVIRASAAAPSATPYSVPLAILSGSA